MFISVWENDDEMLYYYGCQHLFNPFACHCYDIITRQSHHSIWAPVQWSDIQMAIVLFIWFCSGCHNTPPFYPLRHLVWGRQNCAASAPGVRLPSEPMPAACDNDEVCMWGENKGFHGTGVTSGGVAQKGNGGGRRCTGVRGTVPSCLHAFRASLLTFLCPLFKKG